MSDIKRLAKHSTIYTIGNLLTKMVGFIMLPLYTHYLTPADYGTLEIVMLAFPLIAVFMGMGMSQATIRYYYDSEDSRVRRQVVGTALNTSIVFSLLGCVFLFLISEQLSEILFNSKNFKFAISLAVIALFFELSMEVPLSYIRVKEYSILYVSASLARLVIAVALNVYFLVYLDMSYEGILYSNIITSFLEFIVLYSITVKYCAFSFCFTKLKEMAVYGFPLIFAGLGMIILNLVDRYFLTLQTNLETVGLYAVSLKFSTLISIGFIIPFWRGYGPFRFSIMNNDDAKHIYADVFKYFMIVVIWIGLGISLLSRELIMLMTSEEYWSAYENVGFLVLGSVFYGTYYLTQTGIYIHKKTKYIAYLINFTALIKIIMSWYLIEYLQAQGAAISVVLSFAILTLLTYFISQKMYFIKYAWINIIKAILIGLVIYFIAYNLSIYSLAVSLLVKLLIILCYPVLIILIGSVSQQEYLKLKAMTMNFIKSRA